MMLFQAPYSQSRASFDLVNVIPFYRLSFSANKISFSNPWSLSVCGLSRVFQSNKGKSFIFLPMTKTCISRIYSFYHEAPRSLSSRRRGGDGSFRTLSTCSAPLISSTDSLVVCPPSSVALTASIRHCDVPQRSEEWFALRRKKLTASTFSTALGFWKGNRRLELWNEKVFAPEINSIEVPKQTVEWGLLNEAAAIESYKSITSHEVSPLGFAIHPIQQFDWLGASPDGLLEGGILEVKCPYNKGKPEIAIPWSIMPFYYVPQVQGLLEIMNREWADLYCWTPNGSTIIRVHRDHSYWELIHPILQEFWLENVIPAREAVLLGKEEEAKSYKPTSTHRQTGLVIVESLKLANESQLLCRETAGYVEFFK